MSSPLVRSSDVRRLWSLLGEAREIRGRALQKTHLAEGIVRIVGAQVCAVVPPVVDPAHPHIEVDEVVDVGWASERDRSAVWTAFREGGVDTDPAVAVVVRESLRRVGRNVVGRREDVVDDATWYRDPIVNDVFRACGVDHTIYANHVLVNPGGGPIGVGVGIKRPWGDRPFTVEDRTLIELFGEAIAWVAYPDPASAERRLSPRQRETLAYLLDGASLKEIAYELGISRFTVDDYVKAIYRAFAVRSRGELLARYIDPPAGSRRRIVPR